MGSLWYHGHTICVSQGLTLSTASLVRIALPKLPILFNSPSCAGRRQWVCYQAQRQANLLELTRPLNFSQDSIFSPRSKYCVSGLSAPVTRTCKFYILQQNNQILKVCFSVFLKTMAGMLRMLCQESEIIF